MKDFPGAMEAIETPPGENNCPLMDKVVSSSTLVLVSQNENAKIKSSTII